MRTFSSSSGKLFDDKFIEAGIFKLGDLFLKPIAVTRLFASGNPGISKYIGINVINVVLDYELTSLRLTKVELFPIIGRLD